MVLECTGVFRSYDGAKQHLGNGASKVIISAPSKGKKSEKIPSIVYGVNNDDYKGQDIVDCASCTTNALAPVVKVLNEEFGVERGLANTIHAYTGSQNIVDGSNSKIRRGRAAAENIVPTSTGSADAVEDVLPELKGSLDAIATRVPVQDGSIVDLSANLAQEPDPGEIVSAFRKYDSGTRILASTEEQIVSSDIIGRKESVIIDEKSIRTQGNLAKIMGWYDNEYGYAARMLDTAEMVLDENV